MRFKERNESIELRIDVVTAWAQLAAALIEQLALHLAEGSGLRAVELCVKVGAVRRQILFRVVGARSRPLYLLLEAD